jgi:predicted enzyme related to lactoylglutathione lyase
MANALNWFEIPVRDLDRAVEFYQQLLGVELKRESFGGAPLAIFPFGEGQGEVGGALVYEPKRAPSRDGALLYLNAAGKLDAALDRVTRARGEVVQPKTDIGPHGHIAVIRDSEGNLIGLHAPAAAAAAA